jgi:methionyl-tRNA synthetase
VAQRAPYLTVPPAPPTREPDVDLAFEAVGADAYCRARALHGLDARFVLASLDHGRDVQRAAFERGGTAEGLTEQWAQRWQASLKALHVAPDEFTRTSESRHQRVVKALFLKLFDQGDVYKGTREGPYCTRCQDFLADASTGDVRCPQCQEPLSEASEEAYFLRASKYHKQVVAHLEAHEQFICPEPLRAPLLAAVSQAGVPDLCISRSQREWAVPIPIDPDHVIEDWFDALISYLTGSGYLADPELFERHWPPDFQILCPEALRVHALAWPAVLLATGLQLPERLLVRGRFRLEPGEGPGAGGGLDGLVARLGADAVRYALLRSASYTTDARLTHRELVDLHNAELSDRLGRLVGLVLDGIAAQREGSVPRPGSLGDAEGALVQAATGLFDRAGGLAAQFDFRAALGEVWHVVDAALAYAQATGVAAAADLPAGSRKLDTTLYVLAEVARLLALNLRPFLPGAAAAIEARLAVDYEGHKPQGLAQWGLTQPQAPVQGGEPLLPRIVLSAH